MSVCVCILFICVFERANVFRYPCVSTRACLGMCMAERVSVCACVRLCDYTGVRVCMCERAHIHIYLRAHLCIHASDCESAFHRTIFSSTPQPSPLHL